MTETGTQTEEGAILFRVECVAGAGWWLVLQLDGWARLRSSTNTAASRCDSCESLHSDVYLLSILIIVWK